jgi:hypothetical protein
MEKDGNFADYDVKEVYDQSCAFAEELSTSNFVVEFGKEGEEAQIAFDLDIDQFQRLISGPRPEKRRIRWM